MSTATTAATHDAATHDEHELMTGVARRDPGAFEELDQRTRRLVLAICTRVVRDPAMAEEVTQEVMVEAWQKAGTFETGRGSLTGWIGTLARRRAIDRVRSEQAARERNRRAAIGSHEPDHDVVAGEVSARLDHWQVRQALRGLSDIQREAIELAYYAGHTYRDVAVVLGIPEGTAKSRLRDGLARLKDVLEDMI